MSDKLPRDLVSRGDAPFPQLARKNFQAAIERIENANNIEDITPILIWSQAARTLAKQVRIGLEIVNLAAETRLRSERKLGRFLLKMNLRGGDRRSKTRCSVTLEDLRISRDESKRWRKLAKISDQDFDEWFKRQNNAGQEITQAAALRFANRTNRTVNPDRQYGSVAPELIIGKRKLQKLANGNKTASLSHRSIDALRELRNHFETINQMCLNPLCQNGSLEINKTNRRILKRYIREILEFLDVIREEETA